MTREEALNVLELFLYKQCDLGRTEFAYDANTVWEAVKMAIEALEQELCEDAVSRDKAIVQLSHLLSDWDDDWNVVIRKCIETVKIVQPVTPAEKVGKWIIKGESWYCSRCNEPIYEIYEDKPYEKYCPNCGSKMIQEVEE